MLEKHATLLTLNTLDKPKSCMYSLSTIVRKNRRAACVIVENGPQMSIRTKSTVLEVQFFIDGNGNL